MKNNICKSTFFDTDMHLHKISSDKNVRDGACDLFIENTPTASSEFSLVELKGNYIACLILLRRKVADSESISDVFNRANNTGGRKAQLMLFQLFNWINDITPIESWEQAKLLLITHIDTQIEASWEMFKSNVNYITTELDCTRAKEEPEDNNGNWSATVHKCKKGNINCKIQEFFLNHKEHLTILIDKIQSLDPSKITKELQRIKNTAENVIKKNRYNYEGYRCRQIADLIIALDCMVGKKLITSNYKEHNILSEAFDYECEIFNFTKLRSK